ncbi:MAG: carboxypeptidase-like regulatory domain-containing protein [Rubripirellula sp.]|nr:carboxypeptidase-like regulatory domain-containing protein [Rubripirellula sp.]
MHWFRLLKLSLFALLLWPGSLVVAQRTLPAPEVASRDHLTVPQWVKPSVPGELQVRVVLPAPGGEVRVLKDAEVILIGSENTLLSAVTDGNGDACVKGVQPGVYSLIATTPAYAAVYAMHVLADDFPGGELCPDKAEIACGRVAFDTFASLVLPLMQYEYSLDKLAIDNDRVDRTMAHAIGRELYRVRKQGSGLLGYVYAATDHGRAVDVDDSNDRLDPAERMKVFLFNDAGFVGREVTNEQGEFRFDDLPIGVYAVVTVGRDGIGTVGFELIDPDAGQNGLDARASVGGVHDPIRVQYVLEDGVTGGAAFAMQVAPVDPRLLTALLRRWVGEPSEPLAGITGGGGGGGAGVGLSGLGLLAGGLIALDDGGVSSSFPTPPPASPSQ